MTAFLSIHTIYHINKSKQKKAIHKLLSISKKGSPIIVYSNPNTIINRIKKYSLNQRKKNKICIFSVTQLLGGKQFEIIADVKLFPWRSFCISTSKFFFPNNYLGKKC